MTTTLLQNNSAFKDKVFEPKEDIEYRLKREVLKKQIRVREFFYDFDSLRKGVVSEDKFRSALSMLNIYLTEKDISDLIAKYVTQSGDLINYDSFCKNIDEIFLDSEKARELLLKAKPQETETIKYILDSFRKEIKRKRILLKHPFQDFDRTKSSHIKVDQFSRVLSQLGLLPPPNVLQILTKHYTDNGNEKEVNYVKFCEDVDNVNDLINLSSHANQTFNEKFNVHKGGDSNVVGDLNKINILSTLFISTKLPCDTQVDVVENKIQADVVMKKLRIQEFFRDFDPLRKGTVTESQFRRVLNMTNVSLEEDELASVINKYKLGNGLVDYAQFCETINKVFTQKGIEKDPLFVVNKVESNATLAARRKYLPFSEEEKEKLANLIQIYRREITNKRVLIKPHFQNFNKTNEGYISKNQFLRILYQFGLFPDEESLNLILRKYIDKGNLDEVNYYEFCRDVDIYDEGAEISQKHADAFKTYKKPTNELKSTIYNDRPNDLEDLLAKLRKKLKRERIRISEFLRDFDKLRSGTITNNQLRLGLNMAKMPLSDTEFNLLVQNFACQDKEGYVRWREFCDVLDEVFTVKNLEQKNPDFVPEEPNLNFSYGRAPLTEAERRLGDKAKRKFSNFCVTTRLDIKQFFKDWDKRGRNKVSAKQFRQVLATVNFPISDEEFDAVAKIYAAENSQDICYVDFINDTHPTPSIPSNTSGGSAHAGKEAQEIQNASKVGGIPYQEVISKVKDIVRVNRIRVGEFFKDHDVLRKGLVPANKFKGILNQMKIELTDEEMKVLENFYAFELDASKVDYIRFISDVDIVFTTPNLEKDPLLKPQQYMPPNTLDPNNILTEEEESALHKFLIRLGEVVRKHRILLKPHFQDKDKAKSGKISFQRFRAVLDFHKLPLKDSEYNLLCKRFAHQGSEFNYIEFDKILAQYENME